MLFNISVKSITPVNSGLCGAVWTKVFFFTADILTGHIAATRETHDTTGLQLTIILIIIFELIDCLMVKTPAMSHNVLRSN